MPRSYMGNLLHVDLTRRTWRALPLENKLVDLYVGEKVSGAKILYDLLPPGCDPFLREISCCSCPVRLPAQLHRQCVVARVTKSPSPAPSWIHFGAISPINQLQAFEVS